MSTMPGPVDPRLSGWTPVRRALEATLTRHDQVNEILLGGSFVGESCEYWRDGAEIIIAPKENSIGRGYYFVLRTNGVLFTTKKARRLPREHKRALWTGLLALRDDPYAFISEYGRQTGVCLVCGKHLTDPVSVARGIGPKCAEKLNAAINPQPQVSFDDFK